MVKGINESEMLEQRYQAILAAYGADPQRWPEAERAAAMSFAATNPDTANRDEAALDGLLGAYAVQMPAADDAAMARILSKMNAGAPASARINSGRVVSLRPVRKNTATPWFNDRRMMAAGFAFAAMLGLAIGFNGGGVGLSTADASDEVFVSYALAGG